MILSVELDKAVAEAIIDVEDIAYSEGQGPDTMRKQHAWQKLLKIAEFVAGRKAVSNR